MRLSAHSLRLAVSLLLGAVFVALPVVKSVSAATPESLLTTLPLPTKLTERTLCEATVPNVLQTLYASISPAHFERVDTTIPNAVVITQSKDAVGGSFSSTKTVLKKVEQDDLEQTVEVTPVQLPSITPHVLATTNTTSQTTPAVSINTGSVLNAESLFNMVNTYRAQRGLPPFEKDERICAIAVSRAPELDGEIWVTRTMHAGFYARNLPYWATENIISTQTEQEALNWWLNSPVHRAALLGNYKYACLACQGRSCGMVFTNFEPKIFAPQITPTPTTLATQ